jgi:hypothetical protein
MIDMTIRISISVKPEFPPGAEAESTLELVSEVRDIISS